MEKIIEFATNNFGWILTITILLVFGLIGYIYVAALPDLELRSRIRNMQEPMEKANHVWKCTKCGAQNPSGSVLCKGCGEYR